MNKIETKLKQLIELSNAEHNQNKVKSQKNIKAKTKDILSHEMNTF
jgi:hypothetical protein